MRLRFATLATHMEQYIQGQWRDLVDRAYTKFVSASLSAMNLLPSPPMQTALKIPLSPWFTLVSQCASLGDRAQVEQLVLYIAILEGMVQVPTLTREVVVKVCWNGLVGFSSFWYTLAHNMDRRELLLLNVEQVHDSLASIVVYKQSKGIMSTQMELSKGQALMKENLAQGMALLQS
ncbi:hypothetical protein SASPL_107998 [Salvia splendens]|uniref:Uncharacterized protein n=1 Tax=Salvia splendens TaxID=180675 RepID=A0A8X9A713_SALSN|nr:hypothetical protein SASPL_107998 [Salvia splendens]